MNMVLRATAVLIDPFAEWPNINKEPADPIFLMISYVALLALIPAVCRFVGACVIGVVVPGVGTVHAPIFDGLFGAIFGYLESFVLVLLLGLSISFVAPLFGGRRDFPTALKLAVYSYTPVWLTGIFLLLPGLRFLRLTGFYGVYILIAGLPLLMKSPAQRSPGFAALIVVLACALTFIAASARNALFAGAYF
jgi:hypothetical protein